MIEGIIEETDDPRKQQNDEVDKLSEHPNEVVSKSVKRFREEKLMDNISKIVKKILPPSVAMEREVGEILVECVKSFISAVSCEGGSNSLHENREAVNGRDILIALGQMGWEDFHQPLSIYYQKLQSQRLVEANKPFTPNPEISTLRNRPLYEEAVSGLYCRNISGTNLQFSAKKKVAATTKKAKYDGVFETRNDAAFQYLSIQNISQQSLQRDTKSSSMNKPLSNAHSANSASSSYSNSIGQRTAETNFKPTHNIAYSSSSVPINNNQYMNINSSINSNPVNVMPSEINIREGAMTNRSSNDYQRNQGVSSHGGMFLQPPPPPMLLSSSNLSTRDLLALQSVVAATSQVQLSQHMSMQQQFDSMNQAFRQPFAP
jgi:histone H3/H4